MHVYGWIVSYTQALTKNTFKNIYLALTKICTPLMHFATIY